VTFAYDLSGQRTALRINGGSPQTYGWDLNNRLAVITSPSGTVSTIDHDTRGLMVGKSLPNNLSLA